MLGNFWLKCSTKLKMWQFSFADMVDIHSPGHICGVERMFQFIPVYVSV